MRRSLAYLTAAAVAAAGLTAGSISSAQETASEPILRPVKVMTLSPEAALPTRRFFGRVVARSTVDLAFQVNGEIQLFSGLEGDRLLAGAVLAQLDLEPYELALQSAELNLQQAQRNLERQQELGPNVTTQSAIDDAETARDLAAVARRQAERDLERATLTAPFDALIASRYVDAFTTVEAGRPIVRVHDMSELRVEIDVPETLFRRAQGPGDFRIYGVLPGDSRELELEAREFNAETTDIGQSFVITLALTEDVGPRVLPGATMTVVAEPQIDLTALYVPASALMIAPDDTFSVMRFLPGADACPSDEAAGDAAAAEEASAEAGAEPAKTGVACVTPVEADTSLGGSRVRALEGLADGDAIIVAGPGELSHGQRVRVFEGFGE